ncbi:hypothetical protein ASD51_26405 [Streptomyces sp. Root55]|nr:hypothetical protein ASD51_26405 [Streptomyces sp. Root55]
MAYRLFLLVGETPSWERMFTGTFFSPRPWVREQPAGFGAGRARAGAGRCEPERSTNGRPAGRAPTRIRTG